jgi:hypothetical protein
LGHVEALRCAMKMQFFGHGDELSEQAGFQH